jgi:predicted ester cyclase
VKIMALKSNAEIVRELYRAFDAKDVERTMALTTPDARMQNIPFGLVVGSREYTENWARAFPDGKIQVVALASQGDLVFAECIGRGTHTGILRGPGGEIRPTQRKVELKFIEVYNMKDGKIAGGRIYFDGLSFLAQLGLAPAMPVAPSAEAKAPRPHA